MKFLVTFIILLFVGTIAFVHFYKTPNTPITTLPTAYYNPTSSPTPMNTDCTSVQLTADANFEPAAGNVYGNLTITNTSDTDCNITLGNSIKASYVANNITVNYESSGATSESFVLHPQTKVYSQVHYPNGPQCQSEIIQQPITLRYDANNTKAMFKDFTVSACSGNENTTIDVWPLSANPINL